MINLTKERFNGHFIIGELKKLRITYLPVLGLLLLFGLLYVAAKSAYPNGDFTLQMHDTYFILPVLHVAVFLFLVLGNIYILSYQLVMRWHHRLMNGIQFLFLFAFNLVIAFHTSTIQRWLTKLSPPQDGWTVYPPLSELPKQIPSQVASSCNYYVLAWTIFVFLSFFYMLFASYKTLYRIDLPK